MKKYITYLIIFLFAFGVAGTIYLSKATAQEKAVPQRIKPLFPATSTPQNIRNQERLEIKNQEMLEIKNALDLLKANAIKNKEELEEKRQELKKQMEQKREELRQQIEQKRQEIESQIEAKKEELRNKLAKIRDENKKQAVERIYNEITALNKRMTDHYLDVLDRLEKVLENIGSRAAKAEINGVDVSGVKTAISNATSAIEDARAKVKIQASKVYPVPTITSENKLKNDVGKIRELLHNDLKIVSDAVIKARDAVKNAAHTLNSIPNINNPDTKESPKQQ